MSEIKKELKRVTFVYKEEQKEILISVRNKDNMGGATVILSKVHMFSLARFILRIAQKRTPKKKKGDADGQTNLFRRRNRK